MLPKVAQRILQVVCDVIMLAFLGICVKGGIDLVGNAAKIAQKSPALQIPVHILYGVMTFCFVLAIFRTVQVLYLEFTAKKEAK